MYMLKLSFILLFLGFVKFSWQDEQVPKVSTFTGNIRGYYKKSRHNRLYEAYEGIPYAQSPVGKFRFQPPRPIKKWSKDLSATKKSSVCTQYLMTFMAHGNKVKGSEDCLYINIYVPVRNIRKPLLPVMFWIHGGAFQFASGNEANETFLMDRDIVFVAINYRLGPFGFLSTGDTIVPGNMGLKDQSMALRWVFNNIKSFGGDPNKITIFGMSAGGASVHYHYLSPMSAGLFKRGISISGVAFCPWAQTEHAPEKAKKLGALMKCRTDDTKKMIDCLQTRPARIIAQAVGDFMFWLYNPFTPFGPVVESYGSNPFISNSPINIINNGQVYDVPWISGVVSKEGLFTAAEFIGNAKLLRHLNDYWNDIAPYLLDFNNTILLDQHKQVAEKIKNYYLGSDPINYDKVGSIIQMMSDRLFNIDFEKAVRLQARINKSPVWIYYYSYRAERSVSEILSGGSTTDYGVSHGDDIFLTLNSIISNVTKPQDLTMQQLLINFYTSFAIQGIPHIDEATWPSLNPNDPDFRYLHIVNSTNIKMEVNNNFANKNFWKTIPFNENKLN